MLCVTPAIQGSTAKLWWHWQGHLTELGLICPLSRPHLFAALWSRTAKKLENQAGHFQGAWLTLKGAGLSSQHGHTGCSAHAAKAGPLPQRDISLCCTQYAQFLRTLLRSTTEHTTAKLVWLCVAAESSRQAGRKQLASWLTRELSETKDACPEICHGRSHFQAPKSAKGCSPNRQSSEALCMFIQGFRLHGASARAESRCLSLTAQLLLQSMI